MTSNMRLTQANCEAMLKPQSPGKSPRKLILTVVASIVGNTAVNSRVCFQFSGVGNKLTGWS